MSETGALAATNGAAATDAATASASTAGSGPTASGPEGAHSAASTAMSPIAGSAVSSKSPSLASPTGTSTPSIAEENLMNGQYFPPTVPSADKQGIDTYTSVMSYNATFLQVTSTFKIVR